MGPGQSSGCLLPMDTQSLPVPNLNYYRRSVFLSTKSRSLDKYLRPKVPTLLLDLPSESVGENLAYFILGHCFLNLKGKLPAAGNFLLKQRVSTSTLVNFTLKV